MPHSDKLVYYSIFEWQYSVQLLVACCSLLVLVVHSSFSFLVTRYSLLVLVTRCSLLCFSLGKAKNSYFRRKPKTQCYCTVPCTPVLCCTVVHHNTILFANLFSTVITLQLLTFSSYAFLIHSYYQHTFHNAHNLFLFLRNTLLSMFPFNMLL